MKIQPTLVNFSVTEEFHRTRLEAKAAYKKWKEVENTFYRDGLNFYHNAYVQAWQAHQEASMAQFLAECGEQP